MKLLSTGFPWQDGANTYIADHRIGWPGTETRYQFYYLPAKRMGDAVYLTDANGTTYEYRVTEEFAVSPAENWVTQPVAGRDMVTPTPRPRERSPTSAYSPRGARFPGTPFEGCRSGS